ncbi:EamA family transporter [Rudanella paleaurantiibacter]|uniref:EamA family transporter n=1 Tax=Rudanella paleaurantiibacter TaxID=2614655 RepID=A0A7J5U352_9BACT|nr:EamA family transporter [Rudanella paleaurantiibacter]KAB7732229.1 EamA family transporter [Rudanella paleaurantiibacter]
MLLFVLSLTSLAILVRIVANPLANVFQKQLTERSAEPLFVTAATYGFLSLVCLAVVTLERLVGLSTAFWTNMTACAVLSVLGNVFLVRAMRIGDLSVLGPINAYKAVVSMLVGLVLLDEQPTLAGLTGIGLIVAGSYVVLRQPGASSPLSMAVFGRADVRLRVLALLCSAVDGVFLKKAIVVSSPLTAFSYWCLLGFGLSMGWILLAQRAHCASQLRVLWTQRATYLLLFLSIGLMQVSTNIAFEGTSVGYALALFQTSALLSVLFGYQFFGEQNIMRKLLGAGVMVIGASLIIVLG